MVSAALVSITAVSSCVSIVSFVPSRAVTSTVTFRGSLGSMSTSLFGCRPVIVHWNMMEAAASIVASLMITYRPSPVSSQCQEVPSVGAAGTE